MALQGLLRLLEEAPGYRALLATFSGPGQQSRRVGVPDYARPFLLAALAASLKRPMLVLSARPDDARRLAEELEVFLGAGDNGAPVRVLHCPEHDALPYERLAVDEGTAHARLQALAALARPVEQSHPDSSGSVVVASLAAASHLTLDPARFAQSILTIGTGQTIATQPLLARLASLGYRSERAVEAPGSFSLRGGILDLFSPDTPLPVRLELLGNTVESIRAFDPGTQRSLEERSTVTLIPAREVLASLGDGAHAKAVLGKLSTAGPERSRREEALEQIVTEVTTLLEGGLLDEALFYTGFFNRATLLDYLPPNGLLVADEPLALERAGLEQAERLSELYSAKRQRGDLPEGFPSPLARWDEVSPRVERAALRLESLGLHRPGEQDSLGFMPAPGFWGRLEAFAASVRRQTADGRRVVVASHHAQRFQEVLGERAVGATVTPDVDAPPAPGSATLVPGALSQGFVLPLPSGDLALMTDSEVLGQVKRQRAVRRRGIRREAFLSELTPGMYVVHVDHGIGRFTGTRRVPSDQGLPSSGAKGEREYLVLEYAEHDKLFVPTDALDRLSPYIGPGDTAPSLTRLGTQEWTRAKERARGAASAMAKELLDLYAAREVMERTPYNPDTPWQRQLEDAFPYVETPDQATAIGEVKTDLEKQRPMDRLVCGDVGFGKTEVALRAAFKAAQEGYQVALLCPTTVLAQQHYATFAQRLAPYPVKVDVLHRFRTREEQADIAQRLGEGGVDILIGTHRILQKDVQFKKLGLIIVDDEQRFGVEHKEHLKRMRREVDVLTLSATPIPRTLYMALAGVRDMSTIETPPESRVPVRTFVSNFSDQLVSEAILREMDREGQVFFVHNRVKDIYEWAQRVQALVPGARVVVGHGQMTEEELSSAMEAFTGGKADVLVCTTIIEAGLDIPNANTLLVHRPELLGLAQMYQLRGRVGRGAQQAFAYFLLTPGRRLTDEAQKRLKAILAHQELGSGFRIAMRDLEIRGAGNILGAEQSGHIQAVGFDLYVRLLEEAVKELKAATGEAPPEAPPSPFALPPGEVTVDLPIPASVPETYIPDLPQRLAVYQRLARAKSPEDLTSLGEELRDRFGAPPEPVQNLIYAVQVKTLAAQAGVQSVAHRDGHLVLQLKGEVGGARSALQQELRGVAQVGATQVRIPMHGRWRDVLLWVLERTLAFEERLLATVAATAG